MSKGVQALPPALTLIEFVTISIFSGIFFFFCTFRVYRINSRPAGHTDMGEVTKLDYAQCHILFGSWMLFSKTPVQMAGNGDQGN